VSCGGNDALQCVSIFGEKASSVAEVMDRFTEVKEKFQRDYREMLEVLMGLKQPLSVCTIYDSIPDMEKNLFTALSIFNEVILKEASRYKIPVIDLRLICNESSDYSLASSIEPSETGSKKIIKVIHKVIGNHDFNFSNTVVYT
jgi:hypothetical protein